MLSMALTLALGLQGSTVGIGGEYRRFPRTSPRALAPLNCFASNSTFKRFDSRSLFALNASSFAVVKRDMGRAVDSEGLNRIRGGSVEHLSSRITQAGSVLSKVRRPSNANLVGSIHADAVVDGVRSPIYFDAREKSVRPHGLRVHRQPVPDERD